jgi:tetratricopeptide (TPR) repeat protein
VRPGWLAAGALLLVAGPAAASVLVVGEGLAPACSKAAFAGRADRQAVELCSRALEEPLAIRDRAGTLVNRGVMLMRGKAYGAAERDLDEAIRLAPDLGEALVNRGVLLMADRRYAESLTLIDRGIALGVDEPAKAYYNRALAQEGLGDAKAAWSDYSRARDLAPEWDAPRRQLARFKVKRAAD